MPLQSRYRQLISERPPICVELFVAASLTILSWRSPSTSAWALIGLTVETVSRDVSSANQPRSTAADAGCLRATPRMQQAGVLVLLDVSSSSALPSGEPAFGRALDTGPTAALRRPTAR